jgi:hypothetical protein
MSRQALPKSTRLSLPKSPSLLSVLKMSTTPCHPNLYCYLSIPRYVSFLLARAHSTYRERGGQRQMSLPDFFIGADAFVAGTPLLTCDDRRYRQAFPGLTPISPDPETTAAR